MIQTKTYEDTLGQILTGSGLITIDDLNEALEIQKSTGQKVGEILLSMDMITPEELHIGVSKNR
jgi:predicted transcriptional regulator